MRRRGDGCARNEPAPRAGACASWRFVPGHPLDPSETIDAIVDRAQLDRAVGYIGLGRDEGRRHAPAGSRRATGRPERAAMCAAWPFFPVSKIL
ncbi:hypothetical protein A8E25_13230 [Burkholderia cenocepacia]|jgi:acyl-CoA reductase-like NAD-dependent aldehyde dehydrogenase|nr:hypothetical protein BURCENK562V_C7517 [Burkholderia cenocepacia K56-2Valvano]ERI27070.1 hypothetical protein BURCENBC7_AP1459 [Burkholderia cenocepacia BC7]KKI82709.1 hypothetical protein WQ49_10980 [Burkholderia cenocepacia]CDN64621.1 hypothetical protein I35_7064 [Burkholderia cenocepacia H111]ONR66944.1 hypothetical protein A8E18_25220 [Burkholderia cenocepacia]